MSACNYCGKDNVESAQFCAGCGTELHPEPPPGQARQPLTALGFIGVAYVLYLVMGLVFKWHKDSFSFYRFISFIAVCVGIWLCIAGFNKDGIKLSKDKIITGKSAKIIGVAGLIFSLLLAYLISWLISQVPPGPP